MSQPTENYPPFNLVVDPAISPYSYGAQRLQQIPLPWPRSQSVQYNQPSPSISIRSANTASLHRSFDSASFQQPSISPVNTPVDPSLLGDDLSMVASSGHASHDGFTQNSDAWSPLNMRNGGHRNGSHRQLGPTDTSYKRFRTGPGSIGSFAPRSDSGYQTQSVLSNEPGCVNQDFQTTMTSQINHLQVDPSNDREATVMTRVHSDQRSQVSSRSGAQDKSLTCPQCHDVCKCKSDYKKHMLRHEKPFLCDVHGCKRAGHGFTTVNDLDRHKKTVHRIGLLDKSYQCASESCRNKGKIWPRLDNFKQHIERMHRNEDHIDLIKRSLIVPRQQPAISENDAVDPMEIMLTGTGETFSSQGSYFSDPNDSQWPTNINPAELRVDMGHGRPRRASYTSKPYNEQNSMSNVVPLGSTPTNMQQKRTRPKLSKAPQTKAQQSEAQRQRQALSKLSNAIASENGDAQAGPIDLEKSILRILSKSTGSSSGDGNDTGPSFLTKNETLKAVQAITNLVKGSPGAGFSQQRRTPQGFPSNPKVCSICNYAVARECDLRKHMKRHEKPYGCTYPKCHKRFGAKSDWKRHENSQHFQLEAYRCRQKKSGGAECGDYFLRVANFEKHLKEDHGMSSQTDRDNELRVRKIGKNCQGQFWCGFCTDIIPLKQRRNAAWDERFNHIANHFQKREKIEQWVCSEENKTKQELLKGIDRYVFDDEDERDDDAVGEVDDSLLFDMPANAPPPPQPMAQSTPQSRTKRRASGEPSMSQEHKRQHLDVAHMQSFSSSTSSVTNRYCCDCQTGPYGPMTVACTNCSHGVCDNCPTETLQYGS